MKHGKKPAHGAAAAIAACAVGAGLLLSFGSNGVAAELPLASRAVAATGKSETVSVRTQADGTVEDVRVAAELTNDDGQEVLLDRSSLADISCTGEDFAFERDGEDLYWETDGEDVSYQGTGRKEDLPFAIRVSYTLDGKKVDPERLAGASGHVVIRYDYDNLTVDEGEAPTPFVALTALVLDDDTFSDVRVANGRVLDMGDTTMVMGYAAPDLQGYVEDSDEEDDGADGKADDEDDGSDRDLPEYVEVEADAKDFSLDSSITVVSSDLLEDDVFDFDTSEIDDSVAALTAGMDELVSGSRELEGGVGELSSGAAALADGAVDAQTGAAELAKAIGAYTSGVATVSDGAAQLRDGLSAQAEQTAAAAAQAGAAVAQAQSAYDAALAEAQAEPSAETVEALAAAADGLDQAIAAQAKVQGASEALAGATDGASSVADGLSAIVANNEDLNTGAQGLSEGLSTISESTGALSAGASQVASGATLLTTGLSQYNAQGIQALADYYHDDVLGVRDRLQSLAQAGQGYDTYTGLADGTTGSVRFLYKTDPVDTED